MHLVVNFSVGQGPLQIVTDTRLVSIAAREQLDECKHGFETAKICVIGERKKKEEIQNKLNELLRGKV